MTWRAKEVVRSLYEHTDAELALEFVTRLGHDLQDRSYPVEVRSLSTVTEFPDAAVTEFPRPA